MNKRKWLFSIAAIVLIAGTGGLLNVLKAKHRLGTPGIKATPVPGSVLMDFDLPERVLDYSSVRLPQSDVVLGWLPKDTSYAQRRYTTPDGSWVQANIILMGTDRSSIHSPEICLPGQGWRIDEQLAAAIPIAGARPYELRVMKWLLSNNIKAADGSHQQVRGLYIFWFVADNEQTADRWQRTWWLARDLVLTGVLQRWAYVSYFAICDPGQEDATFERVKALVAASVPEFQLPPKTAGGREGAKLQ